VRNLRFDDTDATADQVAGILYWEQPLAGTSGLGSYAAFFSTSHAAGGTETRVGSDVLVGAWTSELVIPATAVPAGALYLLMYTRDNAGSLVTGTVAYTCLKDLQSGASSGYARTLYFTARGYATAAAARTYLSTQPVCAAQRHRIDVRMVATVYYDTAPSPAPASPTEEPFDDSSGQGQACATSSDCTGSHECTEGQCHSSTAIFLVSLPTGDGFTSAVAALDGGGYLAGSSVPAFYTGEGSSGSGYSLGLVEVSSVMDAFVPERPDPDVAFYLSRTLVGFRVALAALADRRGNVHLLTMSTKTAAVDEVTNVWMGYRNATFSDMGASDDILPSFTPYVSATSQAQCWQVTSDLSHPSCT